jgi:hypothetical protein
MATQENYLLKFNADTGELTQSLEQVSSSINKLDSQVGTTNSAVEGGMQKLDQMTGGLITSFKAARTGLKGAVAGMKTLKGAIAATGIGLLVVAVGSLVLWFQKTEKGAELLEKASASLGAVMSVVVDKVTDLGGALVSAFTDPKQALLDFSGSIKTYLLDNVQKMLDGFGFLGEAMSKLWNRDFKGAAESAKKGAMSLGDGFLHLNPLTAYAVNAAEALIDTYNEVGPGLLATAEAAGKLADRSILLRKNQRDLNEEFASGRAEIKAYNLTAEDTTKTIEERVAAAESAMAIEQGLMAKRVILAQEEVDIQIATMALSKNVEEDRIKLSELEVSLSQVRMESLEMQTTLNNKLNTIKREGIALDEQAAALLLTQLEAQYAALDEYDAVFSTAQEKEVLAVARKYDALRDLAALYGYDEQALKVAEDAEVEAINQKHLDALDAQNTAARDKEIDDAKAVFDSRVQFAGQALGALSALNEAFSGDSEKQQKKAFQRNKAIGISTAIINTAGAIIGAINPASGGLGIPAGLPGAAIAAATGVAQIATIAKSRFKSGGSPPPAPSGGGGITGAEVPSTPQLDLSFLGGGAGQDGFRTYVIASEVSNSQQANQKINDQAALVG